MSGRAWQASSMNDIRLELINGLLVRLGCDFQLVLLIDNIVSQTFNLSFQPLNFCLKLRLTLLELEVIV